MLRTILKWRISAAADRGAPLPPSLRRRVDGDPELLAFESAARQVCGRLRRDAPDWLKQQADRAPHASTELSPRLRAPRIATAHRPRRRAALVTFALAASLVIAFGAWRAMGPRRYQDISEADRQKLVAAVQFGQVNLAQAAVAFRGVGAALEWPAWPAAAAFTPGQQVRASAGRLWDAFDEGVQSRRQSLVDDARGAYDFFTVRLPASLGALVGLNDRQPG